MPRMPKRVKFRKQMRGKLQAKACRANYIAFGEYGLQALEPHWVSARQIEASRVAATHFLHGEGRVFIRIFPDKPVSSKPAETRMGKGKGAVDHWAARCHPGRILFEIDGVTDEVAREALRLGAAKLPVRTKVVTRIDAGVAHVEVAA